MLTTIFLFLHSEIVSVSYFICRRQAGQDITMLMSQWMLALCYTTMTCSFYVVSLPELKFHVLDKKRKTNLFTRLRNYNPLKV